MNTCTTAPVATSSGAAVSVRHLTKRYGTHLAVDDVSFELAAGSVVGLIGPNGAGKSTVMKSLVGLAAPSSGDVELFGTPRGSPGWGRVLRRVGVIIESPPLYDRITARQNLEYQAIAIGQSADRRRIDEILDGVGLLDRADDRPVRFSLGMRQRLGIGITLVGQPELIILDEPANGLDPAGIIEIRALFRRLSSLGGTVLVSSHQLAEVQHACDSLLVLAKGRIIAAGSTAEILAARTEHAFDVDVRSDQIVSCTTMLANAGITASIEGPTGLVVRPPAHMSGGQLNELLANHGIFAERLCARATSLEQAFLDLTADANDQTPSPQQRVDQQGVNR